MMVMFLMVHYSTDPLQAVLLFPHSEQVSKIKLCIQEDQNLDHSSCTQTGEGSAFVFLQQPFCSRYPHPFIPEVLIFCWNVTSPDPKPVCRVPSIHLNSASRRPRATRRLTAFPQLTQNTILSKCSFEQQHKLSLAYHRWVQCLAYLHLPPPPGITSYLSAVPYSFPLFSQVFSRFPVFPQRYSYPFPLFFYSAAHSSVSKKSHQT